MNTNIETLADPIPIACARMGISRSTLYLEISDGRITASKARNRTLISRAEQTRWLASLPNVNSNCAPVAKGHRK